MPDSRFFSNRGALTLMEIADLCQADLGLCPDTSISVCDVAPLELAGSADISFFDNAKYLDRLSASKAGFCLVQSQHVKHAPKDMTLLVSSDPHKAFGLVAQAFYGNALDCSGVSKDAVIDSTARIDNSCYIGSGAVVEAAAEIGSNTRIGANVTIGAGVVIGKECNIHPNVTLSHCLLGDNAIIFPGARIGQDGFGFAPDPNGHVAIPQLGRVLIGRDVHVGANTTIDRGAGPDTIIGDGCRIDNLVHISHNVVLGKGCIVAGQCGIAGSTQLGDYVMLAGQVGISGHLSIGSGARFAVRSAVISDVPAGATYGGFPAVPIRDWHRQTVSLRKLAKKKESAKNG